MDPPCRDNHRVALSQINLGDLIHHVAKPSMTLYLASGPAFIGYKISRGGAYEEEGLRTSITKLDGRERLRKNEKKPSIPSEYGSRPMNQRNRCANP